MSEVNFDFHGKNYVVVGASSGIGRQIAIELAEAGASVLAIARNEAALQELSTQHPGVTSATLDVITATIEDWKNLSSNYIEQKGKINGAVYTAGITGEISLRAYDEELANKIMATSYNGAIKAIHVLTRKKIAVPGASYVIFSSESAHTGQRGLFAYSAAKAAVAAAAKTLAHDLARDKQRINTISPGYVITTMTQKTEERIDIREKMESKHLLGLGQAQDISGMALFLLSERAKWITGQDFVIDGGAMPGAWS